MMAEEGINDYLAAKKKAASRLNIKTVKLLPPNEEIDDALLEYHRLYRTNVQCHHISRLRQLAVEAMGFFDDFSPRLVGGVLDGSAGRFSPITLHLFAETTEEIIKKLLDANIPYNSGTRSFDIGKKQFIALPTIGFWVDDTEISLLVFPLTFRRNGRSKNKTESSALSASTKDVQRLLSSDMACEAS